MPIRCFVAGHYRSGSTAVFEMMRRTLYKRNRNAIVLYEPLHPKLPEKLANWEIGKKDALHGLNIWDDYFKLDKDELSELIEMHRAYISPVGERIIEHVNAKRVFRYFDYINELPYDVYLQVNRTHFHADKLKIRYKCPYIHVMRNPYVTWCDYLPHDVRTSEKALLDFSYRKEYDEITKYAFYLPIHFDYVSETYILEDVSDLTMFERFCIVYIVTNHVASCNADLTINFLQFITQTRRTLFELKYLMGYEIIDEDATRILKLGKAVFPVPGISELKSTFVNTVKKYFTAGVQSWIAKVL